MKEYSYDRIFLKHVARTSYINVLAFFVVLSLVFVIGISPALAQLETVDNGGITDKNTQKDNEENEETDLDRSKYKPKSLSAVARDDGTVRLSWSDKASGEDGYKVQRKKGTGSWQGIADLDKNSESYTDRSASRETTYNYRVKAYNSSSDTEYSSTVTVTTAQAPPLDPEELLDNPVVQQKIQEAVAGQKEKDQAIISNLEVELRKATEDLTASSEKLEQTEACSIDVIPDDQIQAEVDRRCKDFPGRDQLENAAGRTTSLLADLFHSVVARIVGSLLLLGLVLNNVWWHVTHKSVRNERDHHRDQHEYHKEQHEHHKEQHHKYRNLHEGRDIE